MQTPWNSQVVERRIGWTFDVAQRLGASIREVLDACADAHAATALYEQMSRLSDAELARLGIPRGELHGADRADDGLGWRKSGRPPRAGRQRCSHQRQRGWHSRSSAGLRIVSYVPQIIRVARDRNGASAISCPTWLLWTGAHDSTAMYAATNLNDAWLAFGSAIHECAASWC